MFSSNNNIHRPLRSFATPLMMTILLAGPLPAASASSHEVIEYEVYEQLALAENQTVYVTVILAPTRMLPGESPDRHQSRVAAIQQDVLNRLNPGDFEPVYLYRNFAVMTGRCGARGVERLAADPDVIHIGTVGSAEICLAESVPFIRADRVEEDYCHTGEGIVVAVLDTGIDSDHPDLSDDIVGQWHFLNNGMDQGEGAEDDHGHGTNVSGIITSGGVVASRGVAPNADILAIKVLDGNGNGSFADIVAGVDYAITWKDGDQTVKVINMSLGGGYYTTCPCDNDDADTQAMQAALQAAKDAGIVTFASSGNQGWSAAMKNPACVSAATAVAAVYDGDYGREPDSYTYSYYFDGFPDCFDNPAYGDLITCFSNRSGCNELAAPGRRIAAPKMGGGSDDPVYGWTGTSQAAPHCAGAAALMLGADEEQELQPDRIVQLMKQTGHPTVDPYSTAPNPRRVDALASTQVVFYRWMGSKVIAGDGAASDQFGYAVDIDGNTSLVGAWGDDDNGSNSGAAYLFSHYPDLENNLFWTATGPKLVGASSGPGDQFGASVAIDGDWIVIGAPWDDDKGMDSGSVSVFYFDGVDWLEYSKLLASDGGPGDWFGSAVAVDDNTIVVGAKQDNCVGPGSGSAYVFRFNGYLWLEKAKIRPSNGAPYDNFGETVTVSGDTVAVGAQYHDHPPFGTDSGMAYVFVEPSNGWSDMTQTAYLLPSDGAAYDYFGNVAISGDIILVGSPYDDDNGDDSGSAYAYEKPEGGWVNTFEIHKILPSDGAAGDNFAISVDLSDNLAICGAWSDDDSDVNAGSGYIFRLIDGRWLEEEKLLAPDGEGDDHFGLSVAISADYPESYLDFALVGAPHDDDHGSFSGSAYPYVLDLIDCNQNGFPDDCDIEQGRSEDDNNNGIPDECEGLCPADVNGDKVVDINDLFAVLSKWGPCNDCPEDVNDDGVVDINDLFEVLAAWGPCP